MPGMDGVTRARKIRTEHQTPLLLLSCTGELLRGDEASLFEHQISKPIKHSVLLHTLLRVTGSQEQPSLKALEKKLDNSLSEKKPLRILLAEDNAINQKVGLRMLSRFGYTANVVANGKRALEALENNTFDLILMDIQMPEMNGIDAARITRERLGKEGPVIVALTAEALEGDEERFLSLGFDGYLSKPLQAHKLQQALEAIVPHSG
jgi:CheY-like chemotaxis protein